jgi:uncharacterized protein YgbK (DUF1537 family)
MTTPPRLGCIADDFTGATDLANNLVRGGMRVRQTFGVPRTTAEPEPVEACDAIVVALKSRTIAPDEAVAQSLQALRWLQSQGATQIYFKYCSTFDSTPRGNIGPVAEALMQALGCAFTVAVPSFPANHRTVYQGHLFVGELLLSDSSMRQHPLTPMTDANLVRVLQAQCRGKVGLIPLTRVRAGVAAVREQIVQLQQQGVSIAIVDAIADEDLLQLAQALRDLPLLTGGSGLAIGLPANAGLAPSAAASALPAARGLQAVLAGSCSAASQRQVRHFVDSGLPTYALDALRLASGDDATAEALAWAGQHLQPDRPILIHSTAPPEAVAAVQARIGVEAAGARIEEAMAVLARGLVERGVRQLVVAGGETSGACVQALGIEQMQIGAQIDPGVPWCHADAAGGLHLALKSGNFGADDFFSRAFSVLA